ncbi:MAG TPA: YdbH domain-containing protein [Sphingomicrobium sp.]|nr:YdbH domain-containing protein [Sphingomicrobium sp.]
MGDLRGDDGGELPDGGSETVVVRRWTLRRIATIVALSLMLVLLIVVATVWIARRPIVSNIIEREFESRGVQATYDLERVGLRTQQVRNLVIGDPQRPDLVAAYAQIQIRIRLDGSVQVYRIVARGVRLRGRLVDNRVSWGQIDRLLPPPTDQPFALPDFVLDVADSSISLATPFGPFGVAIEGSGNLTGGFSGKAAVASPWVVPGACRISNMNALVALEVIARRPHVQGPVAMDRVACPAAQFVMDRPNLQVNARFDEAFTRYEGSGRMEIQRLIAGENGLAAFVGRLTFRGNPDATYGSLNLAARRSRLATIFAEQTRLTGDYRLGLTGGTLVMVGDYEAANARLDESMLADVNTVLDATRNTPIGPVATAIATALRRTTSNFNVSGGIRMVNSPGGGAARVEDANLVSPTGGRISVSGGDGVTYYWPSGRLRIDGLIRMAGGGLPTGRVRMSHPRAGGPLRGVAEIEPYTAGASRLALAPIRFAAQTDGSTSIDTVVLLDGPFPGGRVQGLRLPIAARLGATGSVAVGPGCIEARVSYLQIRSLELGPTRLPVCPEGPAILYQPPTGPMQVNARIDRPVLAGRLGGSRLRLAADRARVREQDFVFTGLRSELGPARAPVRFDADRLSGTFAGSGVSGSFAGADAVIRNVPLLVSEGSGTWRVHRGDLTVSGGITVSDRHEDPRFYPLRSDDFVFTLADSDVVTARGSLRHPETGTLVTNVDVRHVLETGVGHANLDVPGITFGPNLQPEEITRLTEGVVALVRGTIFGRGRIAWDEEGEVTSSGQFTIPGMDLAAPFGPVTGLRGTINFDDLLELTTPPGQVLTMETVNPGILVENGVITYQLLPDQLVKIERGEWPFMGGRLILRETILNFGAPSAKRLTFEVIGLDAQTFVDTLELGGFEATGTFDGVLPMIFDERGGRIVGGRLDSRPPGGTIAYTADIDRSNLGLVGGVVFDAFRDLQYESMVVRLDGDLDGEFLIRMTIDGAMFGQTHAPGIVRGVLRQLPLKLNVQIRGPIRALIGTVRSMRDPRPILDDVLPRPLDEVPGIVTEVRTRQEEQTQTQTPPNQQVDVNPPPAER